MIFATGASRELEFERSRNAVLVAALSSAKGERERAEREAAAARLQIRQLEQQLQALHSAGSLRMLSKHLNSGEQLFSIFISLHFSKSRTLHCTRRTFHVNDRSVRDHPLHKVPFSVGGACSGVLVH